MRNRFWHSDLRCSCRTLVIMLGNVSRAWQIVKFLRGVDTSIFVSASQVPVKRDLFCKSSVVSSFFFFTVVFWRLDQFIRCKAGRGSYLFGA
jgi:hypothetical protein